ncbi:hypothetical protein Taro_055417, partial [Colocasia esculenta]|nr:hypothetical protein [Colocasia esculenta]
RDSLSQEFVAEWSWWQFVAPCVASSVSFGFVLGLRIRVGVSRRLRESTCGVAFTGSGLWSAEPSSSLLVLVEVRLPQNCVVLVSGCCGVALWVECGFLELLVVVLVRFALRTNGALVVLMEVLLEPVYVASTVCCVLSVGHLFGLRSGDGSQNGSWRFRWRSSPSCLVFILLVAALSLCRDELSLFRLDYLWYSLPGCCRSRCGAFDRVSGRGAGQVVFLFIFRVSLLHWWDFVCPQDREVGFVSPDGSLLCLEALVAVWCVALSACGGRSSASCCALLRANMVVALLKLLVLRVFCFCGSLMESPFLLALSRSPIGGTPGVGPGLCSSFALSLGSEGARLGYPVSVWFPPEVDMLSSTSAAISASVPFSDISGCLDLPTSDVFFGFASKRVPVEQFRGLKPGRRLFLLFSFLSPSLLLAEVERLPPSYSGGLAMVESPASSWGSGGASWSEEEVGYHDTREKATGNLSHSGSDRLVIAFPSAFYFLFSIVVEDGSCPSWALPSDEERDGLIRRILNLKATPCASFYGCDRAHVAFFLRVTTGSSSPSDFGRYVAFISEGGALVIATGWRQVGRRLLTQKATHLWSHSGCLVSGYGFQLCQFLGWLPLQFSFARCSALEGLSVRQVLFQWGPASPPHCLALCWLWSHVGSGLVALAVTVFHAGYEIGFLVALACTVVGALGRHPTAVSVTCSLVPFVVAPFLLLWLVRDWLSLLSFVREAHPPTLF